ncbi:MAG: 50S ribosomal protein L6 [Chloroflexi bacterium]|nr:50S ribosomal protein L6 [Anaerolineae bacterium]RLC69667.1 MAG: 50S ribosomal protein L6 [Chloroflexota bacterium]
MSRIGRMPIPVPQGVQVNIEGSRVVVRGPRGELARTFHPDMTVTLQGDQLVVTRPTDQRQHRALHGLTRALLANMVTGVTQGFRKVLQIEGVGYRAELQGNKLVLNVGFSHPVEFEPPAGITFQVEQRAKLITVEGIDKELVGEVAARIRRVRPPEPYKGKGIRYQGEYVRRKPGKAGKIGM